MFAKLVQHARLLLSALAAGLIIGHAAMAAPTFDAKAFEAAQAGGKPVLLHVTAPWCPTCKAQKPTIDAMAKDPAMAGLQIYEIDFDSRKDLLERFKVRTQSTLIAFKGSQETARGTGIVDPAEVRKIAASALTGK